MFFGCSSKKQAQSSQNSRQYVEKTYIDADKNERVFSIGLNAIFLHGDTISFYDTTSEFPGYRFRMWLLTEFKYKLCGDTIISAEELTSNLEPLSCYWNTEYIDRIVYIDNSQRFKQVAWLFYPCPYVGDESIKHSVFRSFISYDLYQIKTKHKNILENKIDRMNVSDIRMDWFELDLNIENYRSSKPLLDNPKVNSKNVLEVSFNVEDLFRSMKYVLRGDSLKVYDWKNNNCGVIKADTATYFNLPIGNSTYKLFNREKHERESKRLLERTGSIIF